MDTTLIKTLPDTLTAARTGLGKQDHRTLLKKRRWLKNHIVDTPRDLEKKGPHTPVECTLVFAQEEAGTAVCVSPDGLLRITAAQAASSPSRPFPYIQVAEAMPAANARLVCVGHPGSEDLETSQPGVETGYDTLVLSTGLFRGLAEGQDVQDNEEIGALMHSCWTYWGHSGAPLVERKRGRLVGLHSSWDEEDGMRRGVPLEAIRDFLEGNGQVVVLEGLGLGQPVSPSGTRQVSMAGSSVPLP